MTVEAIPAQKHIIKPSRGWLDLGLRELWDYRELVYFLIWRDVKVRYKQTVFGAGWAILKPFLGMVVFSIIFGRLAGLSTDGLPGPVFYFAGLLPWILFQDGVSKSGMSLVAGRSLLTKVYFPRLAMPLASVSAGLVDLGLSFLVLLGLMIYFNTSLGGQWWAAPLFVAWGLLASIGVGLWLSALNVLYRDVSYVTPFLLQAWFFATPVVYPATLIPEGPWRLLYSLNPMAGVVQGFRWAMLGVGEAPGPLAAISFGMTILILLSGVVFFRRMERSFADVI
ncbi:MAG: ABC transporter permease [Chloroflexi bacterium]|nr:ABC transporter permease [Chloroflexota bacterium]